jgi:hypothetical protein
VSATVTNIDLLGRLVTLKDPSGNETVVQAGREVRNLPQLKVGDTVTVDYQETLSATVVKADEATPGRSVQGGVDRAALGDKPGAAAVTDQTVVLTVVNIDQNHNTVTLRKPEGDVVTVPIRDPNKLALLKVGDRAIVQYSQAMQISVTSPK